MNRIKYLMSITKKKQALFPNMTKPEALPEKVYPRQYPTNITDPDPSMIVHSRTTRLLTPKFEVPFLRDLPENELVNTEQHGGKWKSPANSHLLKIALIGPTNSGKSMLMNSMSHYVSAVSAKAQTTTDVIKAIKNYQVNTQMGLKSIQLVYHDTPGLYDNKGGVISKGLTVLNEVDFALMVIDCNKRFDTIIEATLDRLQKSKESFSKALVLNKVDLIDSKRRFKTLISQIERYAKFDKIFYTSAQTSYGLSELTEYLLSMAKREDWLYPSQARTTLSHRQIYEQFMKEALFSRTYEQIPHTTSIECIGICERNDAAPLVQFKIQVNNQNQQRLILGKEGKNLASMINRFKLLCAKGSNQIPQVQVKVSIKSGSQKRIESVQQIIFPQKYNITEAERDVKILRKKVNQKLGGL